MNITITWTYQVNFHWVRLADYRVSGNFRWCVSMPTIGSAAATVTASGIANCGSQNPAMALESKGNMLVVLACVWTIMLFGGVQL